MRVVATDHTFTERTGSWHTRRLFWKRTQGETWSDAEVSLLREKCNVETEQMGSKAHRLVICNKSTTGKTFAQAFGHSNFTSSEVDYGNRWQ